MQCFALESEQQPLVDQTAGHRRLPRPINTYPKSFIASKGPGHIKLGHLQDNVTYHESFTYKGVFWALGFERQSIRRNADNFMSLPGWFAGYVRFLFSISDLMDTSYPSGMGKCFCSQLDMSPGLPQGGWFPKASQLASCFSRVHA